MKVLFLTHRLPYAPNRGDRVRAYHLLRNLSGWAEVHLVSLVHDRQEASHSGDLQTLTASVRTVSVPRVRNLTRALLALPTAQPLTHVLLDGPGYREAVLEVLHKERPDVVLAYCSGVARVAVDPEVARVPLVLDMVDVDSAKWQALSKVSKWPLSWVYAREARCLGNFERVVSDTAVRTLVVTKAEEETLRELAPSAAISVVTNGVDWEHFRPPSSMQRSRTVVFVGVMNYRPNAEGAEWLARSVWPLVRRRVPDARLQLVGASPSPSVRRLSDLSSGIEVTGEVADIRGYLWNAAVAAAPLLTARGIQNKVLEAVAAGLHVVVTPAVMRGLPSEVSSAVVSAGSPEGFSAALVAELERDDASPRNPLVDPATLSWDYCLRELKTVLDAAVKHP